MELNSFLSNTNKKIIWDLLADSNYFDNFPSKSKNDVRTIFEQTLSTIFDNKTIEDTLIDLNKKAVQTMIIKRNAILRKERQIFNPNTDIIPSSNLETETIGPIQQIYQKPQIKETNRITAEDIRQVREQEFSRILQSKQDEFNKFINSNKPKEIDFSDKVDDERIGDNMEILLSKVKEQREKELGITYTDQVIKNADEFIKNGSNQTSKRLVIDKDDINSTALLSNKEENSKKQVRFDENNNENITFFVDDTITNNENKSNLINSIEQNNDEKISTSSFLTKLKTKKTSISNVNENQSKSEDITLNNQTQNNNNLFEIKNDISILKKLNFELLEQNKNLFLKINELTLIVKSLENELNKNKFEAFDTEQSLTIENINED